MNLEERRIRSPHHQRKSVQLYHRTVKVGDKPTLSQRGDIQQCFGNRLRSKPSERCNNRQAGDPS
jgi:hypothetical protein